jgi:hypothetical protein
MKIQQFLILSAIFLSASACVSVQGMKEINLPYTKQSDFSLDFPKHQSLDCDLSDESLYVVVHRPKTCDSAYTLADCKREMATFLPKLKEMGIEPTVIAFYDEIKKESWFHDIKEVYHDGRFESVSLYVPKNCQMVYKPKSKQKAQMGTSIKQRNLQEKVDQQAVELEQNQSNQAQTTQVENRLPSTQDQVDAVSDQTKDQQPSTSEKVDTSKSSETKEKPKSKKNTNKENKDRFQ